MADVSISSLPSAIGTRTLFLASPEVLEVDIFTTDRGTFVDCTRFAWIFLGEKDAGFLLMLG
jgi:hypothetical protein